MFIPSGAVGCCALRKGGSIPAARPSFPIRGLWLHLAASPAAPVPSRLLNLPVLWVRVPRGAGSV